MIQLKKVPGCPNNIQLANLPTSTPLQSSMRHETPASIGLAGILAGVKGLAIIESIAEDPKFSEYPIRLFGFSYAPQEIINKLNQYPNVSVINGLSDMEFQHNLSKLHIFVNYRTSYHGETSLSTIEAMRNGVVVIVRNIGWYSELPDDAVIKVDEIDDVFDVLESLVEDHERLAKISHNAKHYISQNFGHEQYAHAIADMISRTNANNPNQKIANQLRLGKIRSARQYLLNIRAGE